MRRLPSFFKKIVKAPETWYNHIKSRFTTERREDRVIAGRMRPSADKRQGGANVKRCFVFSAGTYYGLREAPRPGDLVLAADAGYQNCRRAGIVPDLLLGDFDSMEQPPDFPRVQRAPVEKDDTDTMLAVRTGLEQGCEEFHLYGGTGENGWIIRWQICRVCCSCGGTARGGISMTMILSGRSLKTNLW